MPPKPTACRDCRASLSAEDRRKNRPCCSRCRVKNSDAGGFLDLAKGRVQR